MSLAFLTKTVKRLQPSCCPLDNILVSLFKDATNALGPCVVDLINSPLMSNRVPATFKTYSTDPDHIILTLQFCLILLPFPSSLLCQSYFHLNGILEKFQSGLKLHHSIEIFLFRVCDDLFLCVHSGNTVVLMLLDLTAVFGSSQSSGSSRIWQAELCTSCYIKASSPQLHLAVVCHKDLSLAPFFSDCICSLSVHLS